MKFLSTALLICTAFMAFAQKPQNVILLIGDGMGLSQVSTTFYYKDSDPHFKRFRHIGLVKTSSASNKVTDSAAGATAYASGIKTYNRAIGVDMDTMPVPTILEELKEKGYCTGLIALCSITHATPGCFYAHVKDRDEHEEIARQLSLGGVDFFAGAGTRYFTKRADGQNLYAVMQKNGYVMDTIQSNKPLEADKKYGFLLADVEMPSRNNGRDDFLPKTTKAVIDYLDQRSNGKGFFLMSEGSYIDWAGHSKDAEMLIAEQLDFEETIGAALDFAEKDGNTLVIVTADHETGGLSLEKGANKDTIQLTFKTDQHTTPLVPVFAFGPGAENFSGIYENNELYHRLKQALGWIDEKK